MFDSSYFDRLSRLKLAINKKSSTLMQGARKSSRKGQSAEFSDFREYMPGDDLRSIDWNAYARLDRLYIKEYMEEKESTVTLFLDLSRSMDYGEKKKHELACEVTAALSCISLSSGDRVVIADASAPERRFIASGGKAGLKGIVKFLEGCKSTEPSDLYGSVKNFGRMSPGATLIISDLLDEELIKNDGEKLKGLIRYLRYMKQDTKLLHVMAAEELDVTLSGTVNLIDSEDDTSRLKVTMDRTALEKYKKGLDEFISLIRNICRSNGADYHLLSTGASFDRIIFEELYDLYV